VETFHKGTINRRRPVIGSVERTRKKGSDKGIDGIKVFVDDNSGKAKRVIVHVKSGHVKSGDIRDLVGTRRREGGAIGVFITLEKSTSHMDNEAASAGLHLRTLRQVPANIDPDR